MRLAFVLQPALVLQKHTHQPPRLETRDSCLPALELFWLLWRELSLKTCKNARALQTEMEEVRGLSEATLAPGKAKSAYSHQHHSTHNQ